jgi:hypothetical protein
MCPEMGTFLASKVAWFVGLLLFFTGLCNSIVYEHFPQNIVEMKLRKDVKVKFALEEALKAQRGSRDVARLFL